MSLPVLPIQPADGEAHGLFIEHPTPDSNYGSRKQTPISYIIIHTTESNVESALAWFSSEDADTSAHYVISKDGTIYHCVPDDCAAWNSVNILYNRMSLGIECDGHAGDNDTWTDELITSLRTLIRNLSDKYGIVHDRLHIIGHNEVPHPRLPNVFGGLNRHTDPGPYVPWSRIIGENLNVS